MSHSQVREECIPRRHSDEWHSRSLTLAPQAQSAICAYSMAPPLHPSNKKLAAMRTNLMETLKQHRPATLLPAYVKRQLKLHLRDKRQA